jgi:threonine/homoserine/homoserine lactone efflux protein
LNPKSVVFFFAFLPQFIRPENGSPVKQVFLLGGIFVILGFITDGMYAVLAGRLRHWMAAAMNRDLWQRYVPGSVFILLGLAAALATRK